MFHTHTNTHTYAYTHTYTKQTHTHTHTLVPSRAKGLIRYFGIFHDRVLGSRPHFRKLENFW